MRIRGIRIALQVLSLILVTVQLAGCTWSQKKSDQPPSMKQSPDSVITFYFYTETQRDMGEIETEISKITKEKLNVTVKFMPYMSTSELQQMMMTADNRQIDLMLTGSSTINTLIDGNQLIPLNHLLATEGQDIQKVLGPDILNSVVRNGGIFGIPSMRDLATNYGIVMRKDIVDTYKIDTSQIKSIADLQTVFQTIKEKEPGLTPLVPYAGSIYGGIRSGTYDELEDSIGILPAYDNDLKIVNIYESEQYAKDLNLIRTWYLSGFIDPDVVFKRSSAAELVRAGRAFAYFSPLKPNVEQQESRLTGYPMVAVPFSQPVMTTKQLNTSIMTIHKNSKNPEKAMSILNLLYSDERIINLLDNGIEGKHYIQIAPNVIDFPEGINASNTGYVYKSWAVGNQFLSHVWKDDGDDIWTKMDVFNKTARLSKALGFTFDSSPVKAEYAAVKSVLKQYAYALETGTYEPAVKLPEFNVRLKAAGIDTVIKEKQRQLLVWDQNKRFNQNQAGGNK
ncbi:ABC transporter substrate-binding protein [Paenibacillus planticolens]|uniref:Extracellular solute-binding protein n=1 Tax=Paenibacillus planticolens TaxID=2654976 RepID=A0ABX1ZZF0_9BACL|nr:ABC transporter substrate-binding protein [Paenibacillus planticolens]NOV04234.1 extracellular solute-binding protein [Paenibacillus planticolens]